MVRISEKNDEPQDLDAVVEGIASKHELKLFVTGWTRKTFDLHAVDPKSLASRLLLRLESFATQNGEILLFDDAGLAAAQDLGEALETHFGVEEATIIRR